MRDVEKLRAAAAALIPHVVAERDEKLAEFKRAHEADKASFHFRCEVHGNFLAIFMTRGQERPSGYNYHYGWQGISSNKIVTAINLATSRLFGLTLGREPDLDGTVTFSTYGDGTVQEVYSSRNYHHHPMIELDPSPEPQRGHMLQGHYEDVLAGMHIKDSPQPALDDRIYFSGLGLTLFAPAGLGQAMYDAILSALSANRH